MDTFPTSAYDSNASAEAAVVITNPASSEACTPQAQMTSPISEDTTEGGYTKQIGKVLHVINGEHFSGAERVQQLLGKRLGQEGFETEFACIKPGKFLEHCELRSHQVSEWPMRSRVDLKVVRQLAQKVTRENFDLLHAHTPRSALITALVASRARKPWIYHVHSPTARDSTRGLVNRINSLVERFAINSCNRLLTVSRSLRREMLRRGVSRNKISVVPNGVPAIEPIQPELRRDRESWTVGMIALMRPRKGVEVALEALRQLKEKPGTHQQLTLELIGSFETTEYETQIMSMIRNLKLHKSVRWTGFTNDIPTAIRRLDALVLPSLFGEGMPMVVLEALSAGIPVVATSVEGTPEVVRHGVEGYLAEPRNSRSLASNLQQLISSRTEWEKLCTNALRRHREGFSDSHMAALTARAYRKTLASVPT